MPKLLHIKASPRSGESFSAQVAGAFLETFTARYRDYSVETLDLFAADLPAFEAPHAAAKYRVLAGEQPADDDAEAWRAVLGVIDHFKSADFVVVSSPMWNFSIPYRLKQYIDIIVQPGLTFSYDPAEGYAGLVTGRPAVLILARGSSYCGETAGYDLQRPYLEAIFQFIGFDDVRTLLVEPTMTPAKKAAEIVAAAEAKAAELAKEF